MFPEFSLRYSRLPQRFYQPFHPVPVRHPRLLAFNRPLADELGFDPAEFPSDGEAAAYLSGNRVPPGAEPLAQAYAGHQFGNFVPQLGDGRAVLLGEVVDRQGRLRDIQLKGAGRTPFARGGDGRAPLGPVLREYVVSEAMHALGVPTTRSLAAVVSAERLFRQRDEPAGVLTRVAASHIRVGTFEFFAARGDTEALQLLADHVIERHYPALAERPVDERYLALLEAVQARQAALVAQWMGLGFIHGVMNTDNTSISGETIDYGPCAFMEAYDPATVFSSIDQHGRYAYGNQPRIMQWNLARLAEALLPLIDPDQQRAIARATGVINAFPDQYGAEWLAVMRRKLGLEHEQAGDEALAEGLLAAMQTGGADFTLSFRRLAGCTGAGEPDPELLELFADSGPIRDWLPRWQARLADEATSAETAAQRVRAANPLYIPRNHRVEQMIDAAIARDDYSAFDSLRQVLARPFEAQPGREAYALPAAPGEAVLQTFCGT